MRQVNVVLALVTFGISAAVAQQRPADSTTSVPKFDLSLGYNHVNANAPPGVSNYFGPNGGYASGGFHVKNWLSIAGEFTGGHANNISALGQNLTLLTFMGGPRVSYTGHRLVPYGQILFGGAHGSDSYFPTGTSYSSSATSWAFSAGGGLDFNLTRRFAIRAVEAQYMRTAFPNGTTNEQNHLMIGAGIVIKFGGSYLPPAPVVIERKEQTNDLSFSCSTNVASIDQGQVLEVIGNTLTEPDKREVNYVWSSSGGVVEGSGRRVTINTVDMPAGNYRVTGHASLVSSPTTTAECEVAFRVIAHAEVAPIMANSDVAKNDAIFHENVQDALFDYDSYELRPDAQKAIEHAAEYLKANPAIRVLIGGYADERGSAEYNLGLGEKRANAARNALIEAGISPDRLQIISYGKEAQVCTADNEACYQQNRRAAFSLHP